jgi:predicted nuclease with RNAse H fold
MKHTYIFKVSDTLDEDHLYRLAVIADRRPVSWRGELIDNRYTWVQVFTDSTTMHEVAHRAGFSGEQLRVEIPRARLNGDEAYAKATKRLRLRATKLRNADVGYEGIDEPIKDYDRRVREAQREIIRTMPLRPVIPAWAVVMLERLTRAGCEVAFNLMSNGFEIIVFGEAFTMLNADEARGFLIGLEKGFREISDTRDLYKSVLALIKNYAEVKNSKGVIQIVDAALVDPSAPGSPQMGSTKATKRSKRSC